MQLNIPPVIENIEEIKAIYDAEEKVGQQLENEIRDRDLDTCIPVSYTHLRGIVQGAK